METEKAIEKVIEKLNYLKTIRDLKDYVKDNDCMLADAIDVALKELEKQEKMIDLMVKALHLFIWENDEKIIITSKPKVSCHSLSIEEIKQYFENKANEEAE